MSATLDHQVLDPAQSRLVLRSDLIVLPYDSGSFVMEDPLSGKFFLIGAKEWSFVSQLDGALTIADAVGRSATQLGTQSLVEAEAVSVAGWLVEQGLARPVERLESGSKARPPRTKPKPAFNPLSWRLPLGNPDAFLTQIEPALSWLWSAGFFVVWLVVGVLALVKLAAAASDWNTLPTYVLDPNNWLRMLAVWCGLKLVHELAHALSCKHFGAPVRQAGVIFLLFAPLPFVDVSRAWRLSSAWQRIVISAAGMYVELLIAFVAILIWTPGSLSTLDRLCVDVAMLAGFHTLAFNANPLMRFDGYYILADLLGIPNLYSEGQQRLSATVKYWFYGAEYSLPPASASRKWTTLIYGALSLTWRLLGFFGMALGLIAGWGWWGVPAVILWWGFWFGWPLSKPKKNSPASSVRTPAGRWRQACAWSGVVCAGGALVLWLISPAHVTAPAIVEYSPLTVLRAELSGFIRAIHVHDGEAVQSGQLLMELANDELLTELKAVEINLEQALVRSRKLLSDGDLSKQQAEIATARSLEKRRDELREQCQGLQVRAPCAATILSRNLASRLGSYVERGAGLVVLGSDNEKELLISVAAIDGHDFQAQLSKPVRVYRDQIGALATDGRLVQVEPRASEELPHPALGADYGGPIAVRPDLRSSQQEGEQSARALNPRFVAKASFDAVASRQFRAGQRVSVGLYDAKQCWALRIYGLAAEYLDQLSARTRLAAEQPSS